MNINIRPELIREKLILQKFTKLTGNHLRWTFLIKLQYRSEILFKKTPSQEFFCTFCNFFIVASE